MALFFKAGPAENSEIFGAGDFSSAGGDSLKINPEKISSLTSPINSAMRYLQKSTIIEDN